MKKIILVGGGLAGSLTAIFLARKGLEIHVIEKRGNPLLDQSDYIDQVSSRAIGVSMTVRGIEAVVEAGIPLKELQACGIEVSGMSLFVAGKNKIRELPPLDKLKPLSLSRSAFQLLLNKYAEKAGVNYHYNQRCIEVNLNKCHLLTKDLNDNFIEQAEGVEKALIDCGLTLVDKRHSSYEFSEGSHEQANSAFNQIWKRI